MTFLFRLRPPLRASALTACALVALVGCDSGGTSSDPATLRLDVEAMVGADGFQAGEPFAVAGTTGELTVAQMVLSGITLLHEDGREITVMAGEPVTVRAKDEADAEVQQTIDEQYAFIDLDAGRAPTALGEVPAGRYTGVQFLLGVDGLDNRIAPEDLPTSHPLARAAAASMHWNWNAGFVFLMMDGLLDIDGDGVVNASTGTPSDPASGQWRLHVGGTPNAQTVTLDQDFVLEGGQMQDLHLQVDLARLVQGIDLADPADRFCMTGGCQDVVDQAKANMAAAFTLHGIHDM